MQIKIGTVISNQNLSGVSVDHIEGFRSVWVNSVDCKNLNTRKYFDILCWPCCQICHKFLIAADKNSTVISNQNLSEFSVVLRKVLREYGQILSTGKIQKQENISYYHILAIFSNLPQICNRCRWKTAQSQLSPLSHLT